MNFDFFYALNRGDDQIELSIDACARAGCKAWGGRKGEPPINPPEDPEMEILKIARHDDGTEFEVTDAELKEIKDAAWDALPDHQDDEPEPDDR